MTLSNLGLLDERLDGSIKRLHFRTNAPTQFTGRQVDVQTSAFYAFVTGNERNIFEADASSFEDGTALVAECVRGQRGKTHPFSDAFDGTQGRRFLGVAGPRSGWRPSRPSWPRAIGLTGSERSRFCNT
jgi:hypothetical protein